MFGMKFALKTDFCSKSSIRLDEPFFTSCEAAWSCRTVGRKKGTYGFLPASAGKAGIQGSSELILVATLLLEQHSKAYKSLVKAYKSIVKVYESV